MVRGPANLSLPRAPRKCLTHVAATHRRRPRVTPPGIAKAVAKALGKEPKIVVYSPEEVGTGKGGKAEGFPFR